jgi:hypothetical protein
MAGPKEKRRVALALAQATGLPLRDPFGRIVHEEKPPPGASDAME